MGFWAVTLDMSITLGNVLQIAGTVIAVFMAFAAIRERLVRIETQLGPMWTWWNERRHATRREGDGS